MKYCITHLGLVFAARWLMMMTQLSKTHSNNVSMGPTPRHLECFLTQTGVVAAEAIDLRKIEALTSFMFSVLFLFCIEHTAIS